MNKGRWVLMPLPDWEALPTSYYSFDGMATYCRLFSRRLPDEMLDWFALNRSVVVPLHLRKPKLEAWFRSQMRSTTPRVVLLEEVRRTESPPWCAARAGV